METIEVFGLAAKKAVKRWMGITHLPTEDMMRQAYARMLRGETGTQDIVVELGLPDPRVRARVEEVVAQAQ